MSFEDKCSACGYAYEIWDCEKYEWIKEGDYKFIKIKGLENLYACPMCGTVILKE